MLRSMTGVQFRKNECSSIILRLMAVESSKEDNEV